MTANPTPDFNSRIQQLEAELSRTRLQLEDANRERDEYRRLLLAELDKTPLTVESDDPASGVPARPWLENLITDLERS
jgi:outer membrane protein TolC